MQQHDDSSDSDPELMDWMKDYRPLCRKEETTAEPTTPRKQEDDTDDDGDVPSLAERARRFEPEGRVHDQFRDLTTATHLGWHARRRRRNGRLSTRLVTDSYWPCRIARPVVRQRHRNDDDDNNNKLVIEYLGVHLGYGTEFAEIPAVEFVPFDHVPRTNDKTTRTQGPKRQKRKQQQQRQQHDNSDAEVAAEMTGRRCRQHGNGVEGQPSPPNAAAVITQDTDDNNDNSNNHNDDDNNNSDDRNDSIDVQSMEQTAKETPVVDDAIDSTEKPHGSSGRSTAAVDSDDASSSATTAAAATDDATTWSPVLLQAYKKVLWQRQGVQKMTQRPSGFWQKDHYERHYPNKKAADEAVADYWFQIEVHFLNNVLNQVRQQQQQQQTSEQQFESMPEQGDEGPDESTMDDRVNPSETRLHEITRDDDNDNDDDEDNNVTTETTPYVKKLRAGDEIEYFGVSVASQQNARTARIRCVHGKRRPDTCLQLDNHQYVDVGAMVRLRRRHLRGCLVPVDRKEWAAVEDFTLDQSNNDKVMDLFQPQPHGVGDIFSKTTVQDAWEASGRDMQEEESEPNDDMVTQTAEAAAQGANNDDAEDSKPAAAAKPPVKRSTTDESSTDRGERPTTPKPQRVSARRGPPQTAPPRPRTRSTPDDRGQPSTATTTTKRPRNDNDENVDHQPRRRSLRCRRTERERTLDRDA